MISDAENILNDVDFFADAVDTPRETFEQDKKLESSKGGISKEESLVKKTVDARKR